MKMRPRCADGASSEQQDRVVIGVSNIFLPFRLFLFQFPQICHAGFCDLIETQTINLTAEAPVVLKIIGEILACVADGDEIASPETCNRFAEILFEMQRCVPDERMQEGFGSISAEGQFAISAAMEQHALARGNRVSP